MKYGIFIDDYLFWLGETEDLAADMAEEKCRSKYDMPLSAFRYEVLELEGEALASWEPYV